MTAFSQAAAVGKVLSDWIIEGDPGFDFFMWDVTRFGEWAGAAYAKAKSADMYTTRTLPFYPYEERGAGRPVRTTPIYPVLREAGAVFGSSYGWEVPLWYATPGTAAKDELTFRRPNWFAPVGEEVMATHTGVGLFEVSAYAKYAIEGPRAQAWLGRILANRLPARAGRIVLSPMLSPAGRIAGDFTVTRLGPQSFLMVGSGVVERWHRRWWEREAPPGDGVYFTSLTTRLCGFSVAGPNARALLSRLTRADLSNEGLPYLHALKCELGPVRMSSCCEFPTPASSATRSTSPPSTSSRSTSTCVRRARTSGCVSRAAGRSARCASRRASRAGDESFLPTTTLTRRAWVAS